MNMLLYDIKKYFILPFRQAIPTTVDELSVDIDIYQSFRNRLVIL